jgi:arginine deiminase
MVTLTSAHGGDDWRPRTGTLRDEIGGVWADCAVDSECGVLRRVLTHRPGPEIDDIPPEPEASNGMAINIVPVAPGGGVMPAGNPQTRRLLEEHDVECHEADVSELKKGGGAVHCMTGVLKREALEG